jgi:hypothetical protein
MRNVLLVDALTFEVARALEKYLSVKVGHAFASNTDRQRLVAVLLALKESGSLDYEDRGRKTWFCFGLAEIHSRQPNGAERLSDDVIEAATEYIISIKLKKAEMLHAMELSKRHQADIDLSVLEKCWQAMATVAALVIKGDLRLIGPAVEDGLIFQDLTRSTADNGCYVWFSRGDNANPFMADLEGPKFIEGQPLRISIKSCDSEHRRAFVTFMA